MPATDYIQNKSEVSDDELWPLVCEAKGGCLRALHALWEALIPFARSAAQHHCSKYGMESEIDDMQQEVLCCVPRLVEAFPDHRIKSIRGWFKVCLRNECCGIILNHPGYIRARRKVSIQPRRSQPVDMDEDYGAFNFDPLPAERECYICGTLFEPTYAERAFCSESCRKLIDHRRTVVLAAIADCRKMLARLREVEEVSVTEFPELDCLRRVPQLRAIGYQINLSAKLDTMQLVGEPADANQLDKRLTLLLYGDAPAVSQCEYCGDDYEFSPTQSTRLICSRRKCQRRQTEAKR